uniref:I-set domain-containing protein n=1 Tax=Haemonchus placei TaxID=6290 RepID=A0A0N4VXM0_HAEPC
LKAGFKHEMHFSNLNENCQTEILTWGVDSNVQVPPHYSTEASIIIEEMNYKGSYSVVTKLSGNVTISIRRQVKNSEENRIFVYISITI